MARSRFSGTAVLSIALAAASLQATLADTVKPTTLPAAAPGYSSTNFGSTPPRRTGAAGADNSTCVVYPLSTFGDDLSLGQWIAETIPEVIQPGTWSQTGTSEQRNRITYHPRSRILVIYHTAAVHTKVAAFLKDLKKALPQENDRPSDRPTQARTGERRVVQAQFSEPAAIKPSETAASSKSSYLVPAPAKPPKHLFHLILRYEGEGVVDANVAGLVKEISGTNSPKEESDDKANPEPAKASQLGQLLHFIVRYEGDGIIDSNVVALLKYYAQSAANATPPTSATPTISSGELLPPPTRTEAPSPSDQPRPLPR